MIKTKRKDHYYDCMPWQLPEPFLHRNNDLKLAIFFEGKMKKVVEKMFGRYLFLSYYLFTFICLFIFSFVYYISKSYIFLQIYSLHGQHADRSSLPRSLGLSKLPETSKWSPGWCFPDGYLFQLGTKQLDHKFQ